MAKVNHMLSVQDLADLLQVSYKTALKVMKTSIPYIQVAGQYRMRPKDVRLYISPTKNKKKI